jgi:hypothetical protein
MAKLGTYIKIWVLARRGPFAAKDRMRGDCRSEAQLDFRGLGKVYDKNVADMAENTDDAFKT